MAEPLNEENGAISGGVIGENSGVIHVIVLG